VHEGDIIFVSAFIMLPDVCVPVHICVIYTYVFRDTTSTRYLSITSMADYNLSWKFNNFWKSCCKSPASANMEHIFDRPLDLIKSMAI
jgi:hypothetical protein